MIINKLKFTERAKNRSITDISTTEFEMIHYRAKQKYINSFAINLNIEHQMTNDNDVYITSINDENKERIRQAIFSDVNEILNAVNKQDLIDYLKNKEEIFVIHNNNLSNKEVNEEDDPFKPNYYSCLYFLRNILYSQIEAYEYYGLNDEEINPIIEQKAAEWYIKPISSNANEEKRKDISETLKDLPIVKRALSPEKYFLTTFKPVGILFNGNFPIGQEKKVGMTSEKDKRRGKLAYIVLMLNFDELGNGVKISRELTVYDQQVWNACANLMKCGYDTITTSQIYRWMGYKTQLNARDNQKILDSINTIIRARVFINNENERQLYPKYPEISINEPLLAATICTAKSGKNEVTAIEILSMPKLFSIAEQRGQITAIPFEVVEIPVISKTDDNLQLLNYLVKRIIHMKHDSHTSRKILLNAMYEKCGINEKKQKQRLPEKLEKILDYYKSIEWIKNYQITEQGINITLSDKE